MGPAKFTLTPEERDHLESFQLRLVPQVAGRGQELWKAGAVLQADWTDDHTSILAEVAEEGQVEKLELTFGRLGIRASQCSCAYGINCRHAAAAVLHILNVAPKVRSKPAPAAVPKNLSNFRQQLMTNSGRDQLPAAATQAVAVIERWFREEKRVVTETDLFAVSTSPGSWSYTRRDVVLYPKGFAPKDEMDLLCFVEYALRASNRKLPPGLHAGINLERQQELISEWERQKIIKEWKNRLASWANTGMARGQMQHRFRLRLTPRAAIMEVERQPGAGFETAKLSLMREWLQRLNDPDSSGLDAASLLAFQAAISEGSWTAGPEVPYGQQSLIRALTALVGVPGMESAVVGPDGAPLEMASTSLQWAMTEPDEDTGLYQIALKDEEGSVPPPPVMVTAGQPPLYITPARVWRAPQWPFGSELALEWPLLIPAAAIESKEGVGIVDALGLPMPKRIQSKVVVVTPEVTVRCRIFSPSHVKSDYFQLQTLADFGGDAHPQKWSGTEWVQTRDVRTRERSPRPAGALVRIDRRLLSEAGAWLSPLGMKLSTADYSGGGWWEKRILGKDFPDEFLDWLKQKPTGVIVELDPELASIQNGVVAGTVRLDVQESEQGMDWFDLRVALDMSDVSLSQAEVELLLKAKGRWVRLEGKGWRKLEFSLSEEEEKQLADMGLSVAEFDGKPQRLHALQLASGKGQSLLPADRAEEVRRRVEDIQTRVMPDLPKAITATLRPYQLAGFHFLAYLTANQFGGILADDMGLGKTLQTLAWIAWLRETGQAKDPSIVICPKSVQDNWLAEAERFFPQLRVKVWSRDTASDGVPSEGCDLLVIHYQQLRMHEHDLTSRTWSAAILDEAQAIKNPTSQTSQAACHLRARFRLALTGTPIENRLLDLWAILAFAMPGALGTRAHFTRHFDSKADSLARHRLSARVRPFLLRRTKKEVANDLPDRIEEDITCEMEGPQAALYKAELKRARASLLKVQTSKQLDKLRFNILTSLLRLRQICCHPALIGHDDPKTESTKLTALLELLEPLMEEGHKVLIFSQFVDMLERIKTEVSARSWPHFILTGQTEDRGDLVRSFQEAEGAGIFLISLKAGGSGLNLTAASYVVLFDPWWNPAVEAQAIDRTHRIGQKNTVIAYRLIVKESIEEKIRSLQKQKGHLAQDILGEENFAKALSIDDFRFLLGTD